MKRLPIPGPSFGMRLHSPLTGNGEMDAPDAKLTGYREISPAAANISQNRSRTGGSCTERFFDADITLSNQFLSIWVSA